MSYPILYDAKETEFNHNGIGILSSCISCLVTEETSGYFELRIKYPTDGIHFKEISNGSLIKAKSNTGKRPQIFRVYSISKPMSRLSTISAKHISYDTEDIPVKPFDIEESNIDVNYAFNVLKENSLIDNPFELETDISTTIKDYTRFVPRSFRSHLIGSGVGLQNVFGGVYEYDNYIIKLHESRGKESGIVVKYGKNLLDLKQDENISNTFTGVYPYWFGSKYIELDDPIVRIDGKFNHEKILILDLSDSFAGDIVPSKDSILSYTQRYIENNKIGIPVVSLEISFVQLSQFEGYGQLKNAEDIDLYDAISVEFEEMGISAKSIVSKIVFDSIKERIETIYLGDAIITIADTIAEIIKPSGSR